MTVSDIEGEALALLLMGHETTDLLSGMFVDEHVVALRDLGGGDVRTGVGRMMEGLEERGLVTSSDGWWHLTPAGADIGRSHEAAASS